MVGCYRSSNHLIHSRLRYGAQTVSENSHRHSFFSFHLTLSTQLHNNKAHNTIYLDATVSLATAPRARETQQTRG